MRSSSTFKASIEWFLILNKWRNLKKQSQSQIKKQCNVIQFSVVLQLDSFNRIIPFNPLTFLISVVVCWTLFYSFHSILFSVVPFWRSFLSFYSFHSILFSVVWFVLLISVDLVCVDVLLLKPWPLPLRTQCGCTEGKFFEAVGEKQISPP